MNDEFCFFTKQTNKKRTEKQTKIKYKGWFLLLVDRISQKCMDVCEDESRDAWVFFSLLLKIKDENIYRTAVT